MTQTPLALMPPALRAPIPTVTEILRLALEGLMPATPDLSAYFDRMEGRA